MNTARSLAKLAALALLCGGLPACLQRSIIPPQQAQQEILTAQQGGNCGKGENVVVTTKDGRKHWMYVCAVSADFIAGCPLTRGLLFSPPGERLPLADVSQIERIRANDPCWLRGGIRIGSGL